MRLAPSIALLAACGSAATAPTEPSNTGGDVPLAIDDSLRGPFARVADAPHLAPSNDETQTVTTLGHADGTVSVSLVEVRENDVAASCLVVLETAAGVYVGEDFLCSAYRSDEIIKTDAVEISIDGGTATIQFRTSYQLDAGTPDVKTYTVTCTLDGELSCTPPPAIGGYASSFSTAG